MKSQLIPWLVQEADLRNLQIIVSTHWPRMTEFHGQVHLRTLHHTPSGGIACINGFKPATMHRLTGDIAHLRLITVWVEDELAARIVEQIAAELNLMANVSPKIFGAINNSFSVAASLELDAADAMKNIVVLDGDRYRTKTEKLKQLNSTLSGTGDNIKVMREKALTWFAQFNPVTEEFASPINPMKPERYLLDAAMRVHLAGQASQQVRQFFEYAAENIFADPDKSLIYNIHLHFKKPIDRVEGILIEAASKDETWRYFRKDVYERLYGMAIFLGLEPIVAD